MTLVANGLLPELLQLLGHGLVPRLDLQHINPLGSLSVSFAVELGLLVIQLTLQLQDLVVKVAFPVA